MQENLGHTYRERIVDTGQTLSEYLAGRSRHTSKEDWVARIRAGRVLIDGKRIEPGFRLCAGQRLTWERPGWVEPEAPLSFAVLHDEDDVVAVAKPAGLPTLPGAGFLEHTLLRQLARYRDGLRPLHRLGRHTSGLLLCAGSERARSRLSQAWRCGGVRKIYRALASGSPSAASFEIATPIGMVPYAPLGELHAACADGKPARSSINVVERRDGAFLCDVEIFTGRPHQIRIHLAAAGHPLLGDPLYLDGGVPGSAGRALPGDAGYALHAMELTFPRPDRRGAVTLRCAPPPSLRIRRAGRPAPLSPDLPWG
jgi:23S rRNA pseudouridine1911/1915/1917 synthase